MIETWGQAPDGTPVQRVKIARDGLSAHFLSFGATLQDLRLKGYDFSLVLGYPEFAPYLKNPNYFGSTVGRYANRISHGRAVVAGQELTLDCNFLGKHHLHGGVDGASFRNWEIVDHDVSRVVFHDILPDGHMGFPGNLSVLAEFQITENQTLTTTITATTDAPTLCNFTTHNYFNLDGGRDIRDHHLQVFADHVLPVDHEGIPTGQITPVAGTPFDFGEFKPLSHAGECIPLDHNFCLNDGDLPPAARFYSDQSLLMGELSTNQRGVQIYTGEQLSNTPPFSGIALEPQIWPDAPNFPTFPNAVLGVGETYRHCSKICFRQYRYK